MGVTRVSVGHTPRRSSQSRGTRQQRISRYTADMIVAINPLFTGASWCAAAAYLALALGHRALSPRQARVLFAAAWALHALALLGYWQQRPLLFGFAIAVSAMAWVVASGYALETQLLPQLKVRWVLAAWGAAGVLLAWFVPGQHQAQATSPWLTVHWVLGFASYGMMAVAVFHAWLLQRAELAMRHAQEGEGVPLLKLERLTFRFVGASFVLLSLTLMGGAWFSEAWYGVAWRWDHKTVFALLAWVTVLVLLLGHWRLGWRGRQAARVLYLAAALLLLSYVGSRFVLDVVLQRA